MSLEKSHVLAVPRAEAEDDSSILLQVHQTGSERLDIKFVGTEGIGPYVGTTKQKQCEKLRAKNYHGQPDEWQYILGWVLWKDAEEDVKQHNKRVQGIEIVSSVQKDENITLTIRKNVKGITQRLGTIELKYDESQEIELFDWATRACQKAGSSISSSLELKRENREHEETLHRLQKQLKEFVDTKKEYEAALLGKFCELLNSKKAKIRDQQRLLKDAKVEGIPDHEDDPGEASTKQSMAKPSRKGKRKATVVEQPPPSSDEFEQMDLIKEEKGVEMAAEEERQETPDATPETTDDDTSPSPSLEGAFPKREKKPLPQTREPPPRRELPFAEHGRLSTRDAKKAEASQVSTSSAKESAENLTPAEDDEETDDEL